jgi:hypothetical protein
MYRSGDVCTTQTVYQAPPNYNPQYYIWFQNSSDYYFETLYRSTAPFSPTSLPSDDHGLPGGSIAAIIIGVLFGAGLLVAVVFYILRHKHKSRTHSKIWEDPSIDSLYETSIYNARPHQLSYDIAAERYGHDNAPNVPYDSPPEPAHISAFGPQPSPIPAPAIVVSAPPPVASMPAGASALTPIGLFSTGQAYQRLSTAPETAELDAQEYVELAGDDAHEPQILGSSSYLGRNYSVQQTPGGYEGRPRYSSIARASEDDEGVPQQFPGFNPILSPISSVVALSSASPVMSSVSPTTSTAVRSSSMYRRRPVPARSSTGENDPGVDTESSIQQTSIAYERTPDLTITPATLPTTQDSVPDTERTEMTQQPPPSYVASEGEEAARAPLPWDDKPHLT